MKGHKAGEYKRSRWVEEIIQNENVLFSVAISGVKRIPFHRRVAWWVEGGWIHQSAKCDKKIPALWRPDGPVQMCEKVWKGLRTRVCVWVYVATYCWNTADKPKSPVHKQYRALLWHCYGTNYLQYILRIQKKTLAHSHFIVNVTSSEGNWKNSKKEQYLIEPGLWTDPWRKHEGGCLCPSLRLLHQNMLTYNIY